MSIIFPLNNSLPMSDLTQNIEIKKYYALNDLDKKLEKYINYDNGFFVELGANDGVNQSNTLYFENNKHWKGVLIEPILHNFLACKLNRSQETKIFCNACVSFGYEEKFVEILYSNLMSIPVNLESDIAKPELHALIGKQFLASHEENVAVGAVAKTLSSLLLEAGAPREIDLLSLDVEGAEIEVLNGVDFSLYSFKYMLIENRNFQKLYDYLDSRGYEFVEALSEHDYLFKLRG